MSTARKTPEIVSAFPGQSGVDSDLVACLVKYRTMVWWKAAALMLAEALAVATADEAEAIADLAEATADVGTTVTTALGLAVL